MTWQMSHSPAGHSTSVGQQPGKHISIDCTCFSAACQRCLGVGTSKELFEYVISAYTCFYWRYWPLPL